MKDFPSCFGENGVQIADSSSSSSSSSSSCSTSSTTKAAAQNVVTCIYECKLRGRSTFIVVTWTKQLLGHSLTLHIQNSGNEPLAKLEIKPWIFSKKKGSKILDVEARKLHVHWDLTNAKFTSGSPEPEQGFFVAAVVDSELLFLIGECDKIQGTATGVFVGRREHVFGRKSYHAKARFSERGETHNLWIECDTSSGVGGREPSLVIRIDSRTAMQIKRLKWKFRGNDTIVVDGIRVQVMWDVHNWLFGNQISNGAAVFMFQTHNSPTHCQSNFHSSSSSSNFHTFHFSFILYAWKNQ